MNLKDCINNTILRDKARLFVIVIAALLIMGVNIFQYLYARHFVQREMENKAKSELRSKRQEIQKVMNSVETAAFNVRWCLEEVLQSSENISKIVQQLLENNRDFAGCGIAFQPNYFPDKGRWYELYMRQKEHKEGKIEQIGSAEHDYLHADWYTKGLVSDSGYWSEPYFDEAGAKDKLCTFALPLHNAEGKAVAVMGIDISLEWLSDLLDVTHVFPSSHNLLISRSGKLLACPNDSLVLHATIQEATAKIEDTTAQNINRRMMKGETGKAQVVDENGKKQLVYFAPMDHGWSMAVVCPEKEMYRELYRFSIRLLLLMLIMLLLLGYILWRVERNFRKLQKINREKDRIGNELHIASEIQKGMLTKTFPPYPDRDDIDVFGSLVSAKEVGGDLYDFHIRDEKLFFCIGDVSGKGVPAALVMAVTRSLFRSIVAHEASPERIVMTINDAMAEMNETNMFVTFFIGVLDLPTGRLRYCNAGHCPPLLLGTSVKTVRVEANIPLGLVNGWKFVGQELQLQPQSFIFLYTDGVTEAENVNCQQFGEERMHKVAEDFMLRLKANNGDGQHDDDGLSAPLSTKSADNSRATNKAAALITQMSEAVHVFVDGAEQSDDLTMLTVQYTKQPDAVHLYRTLTLPNDIKEMKHLNAFVDEVCETLQFDVSTTMQMNLAMEEAVVNVMNYAYPKGVLGIINIVATASYRRLKFTIEDTGMAFDPTTRSEVDTSLGVDERPIGGLGIHIVRQIMDSINYERVDGKNILTLRKKLNDTTV